MKKLRPLFAATLLGVAVLAAPPAGRAQQADRFVVHEWGLATTDPAIDQTAAPPPFVHRLTRPEAAYPPDYPAPGKPVVYFYPAAGGPDRFRVGVVPVGPLDGAIFYPGGQRFGPEAGHDGLYFDLSVTRAGVPPVAGGWWAACRVPDAAVVMSQVGEAERFLFYELPPIPPYDAPAFRRTGGQIQVTAGGAPVRDALALRRVAGRLQVAAIDRVAAGETATAAFAPMDPEAFLGDLLGRLVRAGLYEAEARAFIAVWRDSLDGDPAIALYRPAPESIEAMVSLEISPEPDELVRVWFVAEPLE